MPAVLRGGGPKANRGLGWGRLLAVAMVLASCATAPVPTSTPGQTASPPAGPISSPTASPPPAIACGPFIDLVDTTGRVRDCTDLGQVDEESVAPHLANHGADLSGLRVWWKTRSCVMTWTAELRETGGAVVLAVDDAAYKECGGYPVGHALDLTLEPMELASNIVLMHNHVPVLSLRPVPTSPSGTYPSTPASIHFGRWELAHGENPTRDATEIHVVVFEQACASGQSPEGRILEPFLAYDDRYVWIAFAVWSLAGAQLCVEGPGVPYTVELREPLGRRHLQDGAIIIDGWGGRFVTTCPSRSPQNGC